MTDLRVRALPLGDRAILLQYGDRIDPAIHARVTSVAQAIEQAPPAGVTEVATAYATLAVWFDPAQRRFSDLSRELCGIADQAAETDPTAGRQWVIPVRYDGPDLMEVAEQVGLTRDEVIRRHAAPIYRVYMLGFVPGFAYLGELDPSLVLPRRSTPRQRVPAGSVAIAGAQTGVYPLETPGGWHLIGRTDLRMFDPVRHPPALLAAGDVVRFAPVE
jgi:inhibitor of KinA